MTRREIEENYDVSNGRITSPGKFEGEPIYALYFYDEYLNGCYDEEEDGVYWCDVTDDDRREFPELTGITRVGQWEDNDGFCHTVAE